MISKLRVICMVIIIIDSLFFDWVVVIWRPNFLVGADLTRINASLCDNLCGFFSSFSLDFIILIHQRLFVLIFLFLLRDSSIMFEAPVLVIWYSLLTQVIYVLLVCLKLLVCSSTVSVIVVVGIITILVIIRINM